MFSMKKWLVILLAITCVSINAVPAPTQPPDEEEGNGCGAPGHLALVPDNTLIGNSGCTDVALDTGSYPSYPDQRIIYATNSTITTTCPGQDFWIDIHVKRFNVDGVQEILGTITFNPSLLTYYGYQATEYYTYLSSVALTSPGVLTVDLTANANYQSPGDFHYIAARIMFRAAAPPLTYPTRISLYDLHAFSSDPNPPYHQIPQWQVCRRDSDVITSTP